MTRSQITGEAAQAIASRYLEARNSAHLGLPEGGEIGVEWVYYNVLDPTVQLEVAPSPRPSGAGETVG